MPNATQAWRTLPAGRELDALVAERVMDFAWVDAGEGEWTLSDGRTMWSYAYRYADGRFETTLLESYSTDIGAAWQVVEAIERRGFHARLKTPFDPKDTQGGNRYHAGFTPHGMTGWNGRPDYIGDGETMPLAICRAALAAVGGDDVG